MRRSLGILAVLLGVALAAPAGAEATSCRLTYQLTGWSLFYATSSGTGRVVCENGQSADVRIVAHGGGISFGTYAVENGRGTISTVWDISEVFGGYAEAMGHGGVGPSGSGRGMTRARVSLALSGTGRGIGLGFAFGWFSIQRP
jgi:hypothetical protein